MSLMIHMAGFVVNGGSLRRGRAGVTTTIRKTLPARPRLGPTIGGQLLLSSSRILFLSPSGDLSCPATTRKQ